MIKISYYNIKLNRIIIYLNGNESKKFQAMWICKAEEAKSLCFQCFSYYCDSCFKYVHDKDKNIGHKKEKIDYFVPIDIWCPNHEKNIMKKVIKNIYNLILI